MDDILNNVLFIIVNSFVAAFFMILIITSVRSQEDTNISTEKVISQKHNVSQAFDSKEESTDLLAMSSVLYAIKTIPDNIAVSVNYQELSLEERKMMKELNEAENILQYLNAAFNYNTEYIYDQNGILQQINFKAIY